MKFKNTTTKYFSFRSYLLSKYDGLINEDTPTKKEIGELKRKLRTLVGKDKRDCEKVIKKKEKEYQRVMQEWQRQQ